MLRCSCLLLALFLAAAACDGEVEIPVPDDVDDPTPVPAAAARVADCERSGSGVPVARIVGADAFSLATDGESLFYASDGNVFALALSGGEPRALMPSSFSGRYVQVVEGFVYFEHDEVLHRVPVAGGEPEPLVELANGARWAVAGDVIVSSGPLAEPSPVFRSSLTTGETVEILAADKEQRVHALRVEGDRVLVSWSHSLLSVGIAGDDVRLISDEHFGAWDPPVVIDGEIYAGGLDAGDTYVYRVSLDDPGETERIASGFAVSMTFDDEALYVSLAPPIEPGADEPPGEIRRIPLDGGESQRLATTPTYHLGGAIALPTAGLVVDDANAYFIDACTDSGTVETGQQEYRIVAVPKLPH